MRDPRRPLAEGDLDREAPRLDLARRGDAVNLPHLEAPRRAPGLVGGGGAAEETEHGDAVRRLGVGRADPRPRRRGVGDGERLIVPERCAEREPEPTRVDDVVDAGDEAPEVTAVDEGAVVAPGLGEKGPRPRLLCRVRPRDPLVAVEVDPGARGGGEVGRRVAGEESERVDVGRAREAVGVDEEEETPAHVVGVIDREGDVLRGAARPAHAVQHQLPRPDLALLPGPDRLEVPRPRPGLGLHPEVAAGHARGEEPGGGEAEGDVADLERAEELALRAAVAHADAVRLDELATLVVVDVDVDPPGDRPRRVDAETRVRPDERDERRRAAHPERGVARLLSQPLTAQLGPAEDAETEGDEGDGIDGLRPSRIRRERNRHGVPGVEEGA